MREPLATEMASIDEYRGNFYLSPLVRTTMGVGIDSEPVCRLPVSADDVEFGKQALAALRASRRIVPHPCREEYALVTEPLRRAASVRRFTQFEREAEHASARVVEGKLVVIPFENRVAKRGGYVPLSGKEVGAALDDPRAIGEAIREALRRAAEARS